MPTPYQPRDVQVCDEQGKFLFSANEFTARSILSRRAARLIRDADGPKLLARARELFEGPDNGLGWLRGHRHWPSPFNTIAARQRRELLERCLSQLAPVNRTVINLRYRRDLKFLQIALVLGVTEEAVSQMHQRTLAALRDHLAKEGVGKLGHIL